eukprot:CAMPEP_0176186582 /NCGR_PEP_ID=MMETSP0121_2-20121125/1946_1 /TAXON_ID=160619 /ORGANISM="Kryptoperidinium foliaceum, Strain CCMP 1326" /LENGTH=48 /DNA_ID= /DNA_START= /DNA_END= /DNA_ORIENTATION=
MTSNGNDEAPDRTNDRSRRPEIGASEGGMAGNGRPGGTGSNSSVNRSW